MGQCPIVVVFADTVIGRDRVEETLLVLVSRVLAPVPGATFWSRLRVTDDNDDDDDDDDEDIAVWDLTALPPIPPTPSALQSESSSLAILQLELTDGELEDDLQ